MTKNAPKLDNETAGPIVLVSPDTDEPAERVVLFSIDGSEYTIEKDVPASVMLKFLYKLKHDENDATTWLLERLLGDDGYQALMEWDGLTMENFNRIVQAASAHMVGEAKD